MATREQQIAVSFLAYNSANENMAKLGELSGADKLVFDQMGELVKALLESTPNISDSEVMALLTKAGDFAMLLCGAIDSDKGKATICGKYYRQQVAPLITEMLTNGVIQPEALPKGVADAAKPLHEDPAYAKFKAVVGL